MHCPACQTPLKDGAKFCPACGAGIPSGTGRIGQGALLQDRYRIIRPLARGGMSAVYLAADTRLGDSPVALKEMAWGVRPGEQDQYVEAVEQFKREATMLARLQHANLPRVIDQFEATGKHYLVMDYIAGQTLRDALAASGPLEIGQAVGWGIELSNVLGYLHRQDPPIIYRDLKPANVMVHPDGRLVLIDFGIARFYKPGQTGDTAHFGTLGYAPAEQYGADQTDARSDIYALGVLLHELLTGHNPGATPFRRPPLRELRPEAPAALERALLRASADDPRQRWQTMAEFEHALRQALAPPTTPNQNDVATTYIAAGSGAASQFAQSGAAGQPGQHPPSGPFTNQPTLQRRRLWPWALALVLLLGAGAGSFAIVANRQPGSPGAPIAGTTAGPTAPPTATERQSTATVAPFATQIRPTEALPPTPLPAAQRLFPSAVAASSFAPPAIDSAGNPIEYKPDYALDDDPATAWRSREFQPGETAADEFLDVSFDSPVMIQRLGIIPGYAKIDAVDGTDRFTQNHVIRHIRLEFPDGTRLEYDLAYLAELQMIEVPPLVADRFRLVIVRSDPPRSADPRRYLAISTLEVLGQAAP